MPLFYTPILTVLLLFPLFARSAQDSIYFEAPHYIGSPLPQHAVTNRAFQGISSMAVASSGRLWITWYAGKTPGEDKNNYVVLATRGSTEKTWKEILVVDPDDEGPLRTFDPELWMGPDGKLRLFWAQSVGHECSTGGVWMIETAEPAYERPKWSPPVRIANGVMMCKPLALSTGEWALPVSTWRRTDQSAKMVISSDHGQTWSIQGAAHVPQQARDFDEHMFVERKDGSLWMLVRTKYGIGQSFSTDRGKTWPEVAPSPLLHPSARFFITRLASGNLLLVKHGAITQKTGRSHLMASLSSDDGQTWQGGLLLDDRTGISYPDGQQTADGTIYITYDFSRTESRHILMACFREEDVIAGKPVSSALHLRQLVSEASGGLAKTKPPVHSHSDGAPLKRIPVGAFRAGKYELASLVSDTALFTDRPYTCAEVPEDLKQARFFRMPMDGQKTLQCVQPGMLYLLTPTPERNADSMTEKLIKQGFQKVQLPEVRLFDPQNVQNYCTLYQKMCTPHEIIQVDKWAIPLVF